MTGPGPAAMVITKDADPEPPLLVALIAAVNTPAAVGVPVMAPVALTESPAGKPVALNVDGFPFAVIWYERPTL